MVDFKQDRAIYLQMAERICDEILAGKYHSDDRIPSVREQAIIFEVNTKTDPKPEVYDRKPAGTVQPDEIAGYFH